MNDAVTIVPVASMRLTADHRAEMVNQLLFGESVIILSQTKDGWIHVKNPVDGYVGFCRINQFLLLAEPLLEYGEYTGDWVEQILVNDQKLMIPFGSNLSILNAIIPGYTFSFAGNIFKAANTIPSAENIKAIAGMFMNTAYLWGGKSVFSVDCSGFVQAVFKMFQIALPRDANMQVGQGQAIGFLQEAQCGDLAFFDDENGDIIHVGILLNDHQLIHASGIVRIDAIDNAGVINGTTKQRTHQLRVIKRIIP
jgi:gamma-D-glutamyl-L-lysine dipeptidyl-peptidase